MAAFHNPSSNHASHRWAEGLRDQGAQGAVTRAKGSRDALDQAPAHHALPKGVWFQPKTLKDGARVHYGYYGRGAGSIALGRRGTPAFDSALAKLGGRGLAVAPGTLSNLIGRYRASREFSRLRAVTKKDYRGKLDLIQARFGSLTIAEINAQTFAEKIFAWRDEQATTPRQADYGIQVLKLLLSWSCRRGYIEVNRAARVERLQRSRRGGRSWSPAQIQAFLDAAPPHMQLAMSLALETGQRQGDLLRLCWSAIADGVVQLMQSKTGVVVAIPVSVELQSALDRNSSSRSGRILVKADGRPWDSRGNGFRGAWREVCNAAGVSGVTFHDLRGTFITRKLAAGWTPVEVAMCTGHALRDLASLDTYVDRGVLARALAARRQATSRAERSPEGGASNLAMAFGHGTHG
ncbi:tyrosine-type recombinase/integrase [Caulobacter segnis]